MTCLTIIILQHLAGILVCGLGNVARASGIDRKDLLGAFGTRAARSCADTRALSCGHSCALVRTSVTRRGVRASDRLGFGSTSVDGLAHKRVHCLVQHGDAGAGASTVDEDGRGFEEEGQCIERTCCT